MGSIATTTLPEGIDAAALSAFFNELSDLVGAEHVSRDTTSGALRGPNEETTYGDAYPLSEGDAHNPSGAVRPSSVAQVQGILRAASRFKIPLWTISRGKNLGYGGTSPVVKGSVVLDLHRMNKILEVNEEHGYAVVEPGVSFFDLYEEIQKRGLKLWPSCPAIGWGSVIGNTLDRGFGYTPNGEHSESQCGMEVLLPNGEIVRSGMGAMEGSALSPLYKWGYGPSIDGLFFQSNLGIVTKMGIHITPAPESYMACSISVPNEEDLMILVSKLSALQRQRVISNYPTVSNLFRQAIFCPDASCRAKLVPHFGPHKRVPEDVLEELRAEYGWGFWMSEFGLYGPVEVVPALFKSVERAFRDVKGVVITSRLFGGRPGTVLQATEVEDGIPHSGIPTLAPLTLMPYRMRPNSGHTSFSPIVPTSGKLLYDWYLAAKELTAAANFDFFADFHVYPRYAIAINLVVFAPEEASRIDKLYRDLADDAQRRGVSEYRTHVSYMDLIKRHFNFNGGALGRFTDTIKDSVDPAGILSPGKSGVWGSRKNIVQ